MLKVGLTGGIGSGKTTVAKIFEQLRVAVYYSDDRAKKLMHDDSELKLKIIEQFGSSSYTNGKINVPYLSSKVFSDHKQLEKLNALVHPVVRKDFVDWVNGQSGTYIIKEAAILFESGANKGLDKVILVEAPKDMRISRVMERDNVARELVLERMDKQWSDEKKRELTDFSIKNDGVKLVIEQVLKIHNVLINNG